MKAAELKSELVCDWLRPEMASIQIDASLEDAISRMKKFKIHHLVVKDGKTYKGILDARDCAGAWDKEEKVKDVMRSDIPLVDENTDVQTVVEMMVSRGLTALPLKRDQEPHGIITIMDLVRLLEAELSHQNEFSKLVDKGKDFLTKPIVQSLSRLLGAAGI